MTRLIALLCLSCLALPACDDEAPVDAGPPDAEPTDGALDGSSDDGSPEDATPFDAARDGAPADAASDGAAPCDPGAERPFECPDGQPVPWCICDEAGVWQCVDSPENACRDTRCDDGEPVACPMAAPACGPDSIAAARDGCWVCVNPDVCRPWEEPGCVTDVDCPSDRWCNRCARGSCPECEDCVAECVPHGCPTEPEPVCNAIRPDCGAGGVAVVAEGCWLCVGLNACAPIEPMACTPEGGSTPVVPDAPPCCEGLDPIGCAEPVDGRCEECDGASICARCGDGACGPGENICNCPADCDAGEPNGCRAPVDCLPRFWNVRCLGRWTCPDGDCVEVCDFESCGDGVCDHAAGESASSCSADCGEVAECAAGERTRFVCASGEEVPWCECVDERWRCALDPGAECRDTRCDDGSVPECDLIPPVCDEGDLFAHQNRCYLCVDPATCRPRGQAGCGPEQACPPDRICDPCGTSSCPDCDDCVPACVPAN